MTSEFRRVSAVAVLVAAAFAMAGCREKEKPDPTAWTPDHTPEHGMCLYGCPTGGSDSNKVIKRSIYVLSNNAKTKFADWVAYKVSTDLIGKKETRNWKADPDLPVGETLKPTDYINARDVYCGFDQGHQAPLASLNASADWQLANVLSNITPQCADLNEGPWRVLEGRERKMATRDDVVVYTQTGPLYEREIPKLPRAKPDHVVPSGYWKIVAIKNGDEISVAGFIMQQEMHRSDRFCYQAVTVREIEIRSKLNFFPYMPKAQQNRLETQPGGLMLQLGCK